MDFGLTQTQGALSQRVRWQRNDADRSNPSSAQVQNVWSYTSTPTHVLMKLSLIKQGDR